jgi:hypothetical protein
MKRVPCFCLAILSFAQCSLAADDVAIVDGTSMYTIRCPAGWNLSSTKQIAATLSPIGSTFDASPVVMYVRSADKAALGVATVQELNKFDLSGIRQQYPRADSKKISTARIADGAEIPIYSFWGSEWHEVVAYAEQPDSITVFVLGSKNPAEINTFENDFRALIGSYRFAAKVESGSKPKQPNQALERTDSAVHALFILSLYFPPRRSLSLSR